MISQKDMLNIICTEAIEHGGVPEISGLQQGGRVAFHAPKRPSRGSPQNCGSAPESESHKLNYTIRVVKKVDGTFKWED
jgi:hypothetical protein